MKNTKRSLAYLVLFLALLVPNVMAVQAGGSPAVVITPVPVGFGGTVTFDVTATKDGTTMVPLGYTAPPPIPTCSIAVVDPNLDVYQLQASGAAATITLPDVGDSIKLTYPVATFAVASDVGPLGVPTITLGPLAWVHVGGPGINLAPHTLVWGTYIFMFMGVEGTPVAMFYFDVSSFFVIPEVPLGLIGVLTACFTGFGLKYLKASRKL